MAIILLIVAFITYICLYFFWQTAQPYVDGPSPAAGSILLESLLMPQSTIFMILRGLILIIFFYLVADTLTSWGRRRRIKKRRAEEDAAFSTRKS